MSANVSDDYRETETQEEPQHKFCFCFDLQQGNKIIGLLEIILTLWQIITIFTFSVRIGLTCLIVFQLPLLFTYMQSRRLMRQQEQAEDVKH